MWNWIVGLWNKAVKVFKEFMAIALPIVSQIVIAELKDFAVDVVTSFDGTTLTNDEKRKAAFNAIKAEAISRGISVSTSLLNTLVELAVQYIRSLRLPVERF